jgi:IMP dehydrogenase
MPQSRGIHKRKCDVFFQKQAQQGLALGFGDVRLKTGYSEVLPSQTWLHSQFSRNIGVNIPIISSPMDTVTESKMAIAMAKFGGLGIIHKGLSPEEQAAQVAKVKHNLSAFIAEPICVKGTEKVADVLRMRDQKDYGFSSFPVVDEGRRLIGIVTSNDFEFCHDVENKTIFDIMSTDIVSSEFVDVRGAYQAMQERHKKILPIVDKFGLLSGIYTWKDVKRITTNDAQGYSLDKNGSLLVGAAIGTNEDDLLRAKLLALKGVDVFVVDTAHGDSKRVIEMVKYLKLNYPSIDVVAGNISEGDAAKRLVDAGADGVRVGQGPGSICTTRIIAGIGHPQVSAVYECAKALRGTRIPVCADGGIEYSGDITIALGVGADTVMLGKLLAGTTESPGSVLYRNGKSVKVYRGMGSLGAMLDNKASRERYGQTGNTSDKLVPEGVEAEIAFKGDVANILFQLTGGLRSGMGYVGATSLESLQDNADFYRQSSSGSAESHPHVENMKDAPNYRGTN